MVEVQCPICGKIYNIPEGRGRAMVETRFLHHKDSCKIPREDEFVKVGNRVGIVVEVLKRQRAFPKLTVQFPSGNMQEYGASEIVYPEDQEKSRAEFFA